MMFSECSNLELLSALSVLGEIQTISPELKTLTLEEIIETIKQELKHRHKCKTAEEYFNGKNN